MKNLKELFVSKDIAIQLKEKGFDEPCMVVYRGGDLYFDKMMSGYVSDITENTEFSKNSDLNHFSINEKDKHYWITAPMLVQVIDWFRDNHNILLTPLVIGTNKKVLGYKWFVQVGMKDEFYETKAYPYHDGYYEGLNKAIEEALKLI